MKLTNINNPNCVYKSPKGREFRTISIERVKDTEKWIGREQKSKWRVLIKYADNGVLLWLYFDYSDILTETRAFSTTI